MILALDVGNSQIHGGVFDEGRLRFQFRKATTSRATSDEIGLFLLQILREQGVSPGHLTAVGLASVVPALTQAMVDGIVGYLGLKPFVLQPGAKTGLKIRTKSPEEVGADRIANCVGALGTHPDKNLIVVDQGTATTFDCISKDRSFLGGVIAPGLRISMEALTMNTAKLPPVDIVAMKEALGRSTITNIQAGLYLGHVGLIREVLPRLKKEAFDDDPDCFVIGTGGYSKLFEDEALFDVIETDLVLKGVLFATQLNTQKKFQQL